MMPSSLAHGIGMAFYERTPSVDPIALRLTNILPALPNPTFIYLEKAQNPTFLSGQLESRCAFLSIELGL
jgi:hypothetical protein